MVLPGGLLVLTGRCLTQFYYHDLYGALILALVNAFIVLLFLKTLKKLAGDNSFLWFLAVIAPCLLIMFQVNFNWPLQNNIGFLLSILVFYSTISGKGRLSFWLSILLFPAFYYSAGVFAWIYLCMMLVYGIFYNHGIQRISEPFIYIIVGVVTFFLFKYLVLFQPDTILLFHPYSFRDNYLHTWVIYMLAGFLILFPAIVKANSGIDFSRKSGTSIQVITTGGLLVIAILMPYRWRDPNIKQLFQLERYVYEQKWDELITCQEKWQLRNIVAEYYYNLALSEKGALCERMFLGPQDYGPKTLIIPWDSNAGMINISRGVYFYYCVGLINEAHRWAYESMVAQGYRPESLKMLVKTNLLKGDFRLAKIYIGILKKTLHYKSWAIKYERMLGHPELIKEDDELGRKFMLLPRSNFSVRIRNPQTNLELILKDNPQNRIAFEYLIAWHLLDKNLGAFMEDLASFKNFSYTEIPRHIEEAMLVFQFGSGIKPDLGNVSVKKDTYDRYRVYRNKTDLFLGTVKPDPRSLENSAGKNYWYYYDFI